MNTPDSLNVMFLIPPMGAARELSISGLNALSNILPDQVDSFDYKAYLEGYTNLLKIADDDLIADMIGQSLLTKVIEKKSEVVIVTALCPLSNYFISLFKSLKIKTALWYYEDYRTVPFWQQSISHYDFFFGIQKGQLESSFLNSTTQFHFLPNAAQSIPNTIPSLNSRSFDLSFIGIPSEYRITFIEELISKGIKVAIAGKGWNEVNNPVLQPFIIDGNWVNPTKAFSIYSSSKFGLNLSVSPPKSNLDQNQVSPRAFDIISSGAYLITERSILNSISMTDLSYGEVTSPNEAIQIIKSDINIESHIQKNMASIINKHSLEHRMQYMIEAITK
jgi:hypothetical protein